MGLILGNYWVVARVATYMSSCQLIVYNKNPFAKVIRAQLLCWLECLVLMWGWSGQKMVVDLNKKTSAVLGAICNGRSGEI